MYTISCAHKARVVLLPWSIYTDGRRLSYSPRPASSRVYLWQVSTNWRPTVTSGCPMDWQSWTRVPGFGGRQTRKPGFEKYRPGMHSLFTTLFWRLNVLNVRRLKRSSTFWEKKSAPPEKILATRMRKGPGRTLVWGPEWLIRPWTPLPTPLRVQDDHGQLPLSPKGDSKTQNGHSCVKSHLFCVFFTEFDSFAGQLRRGGWRLTCIMSAKYYLSDPVFHFLPKLTHSAVRSLCDNWATC